MEQAKNRKVTKNGTSMQPGDVEDEHGIARTTEGMIRERDGTVSGYTEDGLHFIHHGEVHVLEARKDRVVAHRLRPDPLVALFSRLANWRAAVLMTDDRRPDVQWLTQAVGEKHWRVFISVDGESVFDMASSHAWQLAVDAERAFRTWADNRDRKENEAKLDASVKDLPKP
jgi:hypothetical protein